MQLGNDWCCKWGEKRPVDLCFARHSGYGGYSCDGYAVGSRIVRFTKGEGGNFTLETHVRLNNSEVVHRGVLAALLGPPRHLLLPGRLPTETRWGWVWQL